MFHNTITDSAAPAPHLEILRCLERLLADGAGKVLAGLVDNAVAGVEILGGVVLVTLLTPV